MLRSSPLPVASASPQKAQCRLEPEAGTQAPGSSTAPAPRPQVPLTTVPEPTVQPQSSSCSPAVSQLPMKTVAGLLISSFLSWACLQPLQSQFLKPESKHWEVCFLGKRGRKPIETVAPTQCSLPLSAFRAPDLQPCPSSCPGVTHLLCDLPSPSPLTLFLWARCLVGCWGCFGVKLGKKNQNIRHSWQCHGASPSDSPSSHPSPPITRRIP